MSIRMLGAFLTGVCTTALAWAVWGRLAPKKRHWQLPQQKLIELGLTRGDFEVIRATYERSNARIWEVLMPVCIRALGAEAEAARAMGMRNCWHSMRLPGRSMVIHLMPNF